MELTSGFSLRVSSERHHADTPWPITHGFAWRSFDVVRRQRGEQVGGPAVGVWAKPGASTAACVPGPRSCGRGRRCGVRRRRLRSGRVMHLSTLPMPARGTCAGKCTGVSIQSSRCPASVVHARSATALFPSAARKPAAVQRARWSDVEIDSMRRSEVRSSIRRFKTGNGPGSMRHPPASPSTTAKNVIARVYRISVAQRRLAAA